MTIEAISAAGADWNIGPIDGPAPAGDAKSGFGGMEISASALTAQRLRMNVTAENLANAETTKGADGNPYRRKEVVLQEAAGSFGASLSAAMGPNKGTQGGGVEVAGVVQDTATPLKRVYDPGHPDADAQGYVSLPNVNPVSEMTDLISASRAYEANVTAMQSAKTLFTKTLEILR
jgi:flagellar basal-body rod protein FlgC